MPFKKIGKKWFPLKKNGKPWKSGFPTEGKARAAVAANKKRLSKLGGKSKSPKKKTRKSKNPRKKKSKKKSGGGNVANNSKNKINLTSPSNIAKMYALGGSAAHHAAFIAQNPADAERAGKLALRTYTGYDLDAGKFELGELWRGYGGAANDAIYRKVAKGIGIKAYPQANPKNFSQVLDYLCMYGDSITQAAANKDNPLEANRKIYEGQYGVDLGIKGFNSWQPAEMLRTKGPYIAKKIIFKLLRQAGFKL